MRFSLPGRGDPGAGQLAWRHAQGTARLVVMGARMQPPGDQSFYRGGDRIIGGVCSGLAEGFHVDPLWVRLAFVVLTFLQGVGVLLYVVLWFLMPERPGYRPAAQTTFQSMNNDLKRAWADLRAQFGGTRPPAPASSVAAEPSSSVTTSEAPTSGEV